MGGWQSTQPQQAAATTAGGASASAAGLSAAGNNNKGDVVVIPVDASQQAEAAFLWYVKHVHRPENVVRILHIQELSPTSPMLAEHAFRTDSWSDLVARANEQGKEIVNKYENKLKEHSLQGSVSFEMGKPGETVVNAADKNKAAMIIMGTRGFGVIRRTILGSVSEYVIHHTRVPVTVVPKETQHWFF